MDGNGFWSTPGFHPGWHAKACDLIDAFLAAAGIESVSLTMIRQLDPGAVGRCEVHVEPGIPSKPETQGGCLVRGVVVENEVGIQSFGHRVVHGTKRRD